MIAGKMAGITSRLFGVPCWAEQTMFATRGAPHDEFLVRPTDLTIEDRLSKLLDAGKATSADLAVALQKLKSEIAERSRVEQQLRDKLALIRQQENALRALSAPILQIWNGVIAVPIIGELDADSAAALMDRLGKMLETSDTEHVILDLTAVTSVDTATADHLIQIVRSVELLGARVIITGIRAAVSQTIVALGVDLGKMTTLRNLREGLRTCVLEAGAAAANAGRAGR